MRTYDVYLKKKLTEIDVIITQLVQRDVLLMYNKLLLLCDPIDANLVKCVMSNIISELRVSIDELNEFVYESSDLRTLLEFSSDVYSKVFDGAESKLYLSVDEFKLIKGFCFEFEEKLEIAIEPLDYYIGHSLGNGYTKMYLLLSNPQTQKTAFELIQNEFFLRLSTEFSSRKVAEFNKLINYFSPEETNIYYQCQIAGEALTHLMTFPIEDYAFKKTVSNLGDPLYLTMMIDSAIELFGYISSEIVSFLITELDTNAEKAVDFNSMLMMLCDAHAGLKRFRLLSDMDDHFLEDYDNMTLEELTYVIIAE